MSASAGCAAISSKPERDAGVRTAGLLARQSPERLEAIRAGIENGVNRYARGKRIRDPDGRARCCRLERLRTNKAEARTMLFVGRFVLQAQANCYNGACYSWAADWPGRSGLRLISNAPPAPSNINAIASPCWYESPQNLSGRPSARNGSNNSRSKP